MADEPRERNDLVLKSSGATSSAAGSYAFIRIAAWGHTIARLPAVDADVGLPDRDLGGELALLEARRAGGEGAVDGHGGHGEQIALAGHHLHGHAFDELRRPDRSRFEQPIVGGDGGHLGRNLHLDHFAECPVDRRMVLLDDQPASSAVGLRDRLLHRRDRLVVWHHVRQCEVAGLHHGVDAPGHTDLGGHAGGIDREDAQLPVDDLALDGLGEVSPDLVGRERCVEQEDPAVASVLEHVESIEQAELVAGDEVGLLHEVGRADRGATEAKVRHGHRAGLLRVVDEVPLGVEVGLRADDLHGGLVRADGPVGAERIEHGRAHVGIHAERVVHLQAQAADVVDDADREPPLRRLGSHLVEHGLGHRRRELLRAETVTAADHADRGAVGLGERGHHVLEQRLADRTGLLRPVEHGDRTDRIGECGEQCVDRERAEQAHGGDPDPLSVGDQLLDRFADRARAGAHDDDDAFGVGGTFVVDEPVAAAGRLGQLVEGGCDSGGNGVVIGVRRLPAGRRHRGSVPCPG